MQSALCAVDGGKVNVWVSAGRSQAYSYQYIAVGSRVCGHKEPAVVCYIYFEGRPPQ